MALKLSVSAQQGSIALAICDSGMPFTGTTKNVCDSKGGWPPVAWL
eukprot:CAMPEP_0181494862 /NCGR_PEP_ID=MMETSP1110-20121109/52048_1 /TAXON_ID=174948 /ORGANISM="Symbiodinium sp., Strain CCMP421" /LENGTH=45 /DNA_ID= /DNA_START= /DNA_END= /DNA_ORIENTATION=